MPQQTTLVRLPTALQVVTPDWLGNALSTRVPGMRIASAVRDAERCGTSTSARSTFAHGQDSGHADLPETIDVNGGCDPAMRRRLGAALIQEARFYFELAQDAPVNSPLVYFADVDDEAQQGAVILEDMAR